MYRRAMCISFAIFMYCTIYFLRNYKYMSASKTLLSVQNSHEKRHKLKEKHSGCSDSLLAADPLHSSIYTEGKDALHLGDYVRFKVVLFNGYGKPMVTGGDHLRARLYNPSIGAYTSGTIFDQKNGTYTLIFQSLWTGLARLEVELLYTKEIIAASIRLRKTWDFSDIMVKFSNKHRGTEITKCNPDEKTAAMYSRISKVCDFSYWSKSLQWYCAMPEQKLTCKNWVSISRNWENYTKDINKCEENLSSKRNFKRIPSNITVQIRRNLGDDNYNVTIAEPEIPCSSYNFTKLWFMETPTGYFYNNKWYLMHCKGNTRFDGECLRNKTILFWGDSTLYQWFYFLKSQLAAKSTFLCKVLVNAEHASTSKCFYYKYNLTLYAMMHNIPVSFQKNYNRNNLYDVFKANLFEKIINKRESDDFILVIHLYAHIQQYNFDFCANLFYEIKMCLKRILKMDIKIKVFIKLPHTYRRYKDKAWEIRQCDYIGFIYTDIIRKIFKGLHNRVIVLDQKDATIARRNVLIHPSALIVKEMVHTLMSYACRSN